jgi:hypothetical protein
VGGATWIAASTEAVVQQLDVVMSARTGSFAGLESDARGLRTRSHSLANVEARCILCHPPCENLGSPEKPSTSRCLARLLLLQRWDAAW